LNQNSKSKDSIVQFRFLNSHIRHKTQLFMINMLLNGAPHKHIYIYRILDMIWYGFWFVVLPHLRTAGYENASKKYHSSRTFQQYQEHIAISLKTLVMILLNFLWQICWIFNNSCIVNLLYDAKLPSCIFSYRGFSKYTKDTKGVVVIYRFQLGKKHKRNKLLYFHVRFVIK
jgi:hypothetical protein